MRTIFTPWLFPVLFIFGYVLYMAGLVKSISAPSAITTVYVFSSVFLYCAGVLLARVLNFDRALPQKIFGTCRSSRGIRLCWTGYLISLLFFLYEYANFVSKYGAVPVLLDDFELLRFDFGVNGYIHIVAMMNTLFTMMLLVDYLFSKDLLSKRNRFFVIAASLSTAMLVILMGHRGVLLNILAPALIAYSFRGGKKIVLKLSIIGFVVFYLFGAAKLFRDYSLFGDAVFNTVGDDWVFGNSVILSPLYYSYLGIAMNYNMLNEYVLAIREHMYGYFTIVKPLMSPFPWFKYGMIEYQKDILRIDYHGTLTSTMLAIPYIDYGFFGAFVIGLIGWINGVLYRLVALTSSCRYLVPYVYVAYQTLIGIYTYPFYEFYVILYVVVSIIFAKKMYRYIRPPLPEGPQGA